MKTLLHILTFFCLTLLFSSCNKKKADPEEPVTVAPPPAAPPDTTGWHVRSSVDNLKMGNPSNAVPDTTHYTNFLISKFQYSMSYNRNRGGPNWVSWHLSANWLGFTTRQDLFTSDFLPANWFVVSSNNYTGSGFDRGHNCPSADRTMNDDDNASTFMMTNIIPQAPIHNQTTWSNLENYCRKLANAGNELYIIMGSYGMGGTGSNGKYNSLAGGRIAIPAYIWKAILVIPNGNEDISRVNAETRLIAVNTPNTNMLNSTWGSYRVSVDSLEKATGYDLFSRLPKTIQAVLEAKVDNGPTQ